MKVTRSGTPDDRIGGRRSHPCRTISPATTPPCVYSNAFPLWRRSLGLGLLLPNGWGGSRSVPARRSKVGMDLMLCLDLSLADGIARLYLPVTPQGNDTWVTLTVLTNEQAIANLADV